jgi:hypothetical protein
MFDTPDLDESGLGERVGYEVVVPRASQDRATCIGI